MSSTGADSVLLSHPGCGPFVQQTARALHEARLLAAYVTTFCYTPGSATGRALRTVLRVTSSDPERQLLRRQITEVPLERVITHPMPEYLRMLALKLPCGPIASDMVWEKTERWFDRIVGSNHLAQQQAVYAYENSALETFRQQKRRGGLCIYEMPISYYKTTEALVQPELERFPELQTTFTAHSARHTPRRNVRKDQELALADWVVANSTFTKQSLIDAGVPESRITVIPLGAPPADLRPISPKGTPFVFLSAGTQSVRKGSHYLLEAWRQLAPGKEAELWMIGHRDLPDRLLEDLPSNVVFRPSVPRQELAEIYRRAQVLVFPSLAEGFGMVITEAMAAGLPVITTANTAGADLIQHGQNGFLVPIRDARRLAETMQWCLEHERELREFGREAALTASRWQWEDYRTALSRAVAGFLAAPATNPAGPALRNCQ